jgi:NADH-quinone oxidoreductase subunit J
LASEQLAFFAFAAIAVFGSLFVILQRNPIYSVLALVAAFFGLSGLYVLLEAPFVAIVQIIIYAGAIMVLFLFVLMLLGIEREEVLTETIRGQRPAAVLLTLGLLVAIVAALLAGVFDTAPASLAAANQGGNVQAVGRLLFTHYTFAFETAGVLLVVAAVGALVLGKRQP